MINTDIYGTRQAKKKGEASHLHLRTSALPSHTNTGQQEIQVAAVSLSSPSCYQVFPLCRYIYRYTYCMYQCPGQRSIALLKQSTVGGWPAFVLFADCANICAGIKRRIDGRTVRHCRDQRIRPQYKFKY